MRPDFKHLIRDLYVSLGLPVPTQLTESGVRLFVGDTEVHLVPHPYDARLMLRADVGVMTQDRHSRAGQAEDLLRRHAGNILEFAATLAVDAENSDLVIVTATFRYGTGSTAELRVLIEDVATLVARYRPVLRPAASLRSPQAPQSFEPAIIFQP